MRLIAETTVFAAAVLTALRYFGVRTEIAEIDRCVAILLDSIYSAQTYLLS